MLPRHFRWAIAIVATLTMTVSYIDRSTLATLAPTVTDELDISETAYGWLASAFSIAYLIGTPLAGWWIDRAGARRGLVGSVFAWSIVAALHAIVPGFAMLFALRIALGLAESPGFPGAAQTMQRVLEPSDRERGFGLLFTGSSIGGMIAPLLAGALFNAAGWRVAFLGSALVGLLWIPAWIALTSRRDARAVLDVIESPGSAGARSAAERRGDMIEPPAKRLPVTAILRHPVVIRALFAIFAVAPIVGFLQSWGAKYLVRAFAMKQGDVGHYLWFPPLMLDAGALVFGDLASRQRRGGAPPNALFAIAALVTAGFAALPLAQTPWDGMTIIGIGMAGGGGVYTLVTADMLARLPIDRVSVAGGILAGAQSLALIASTPLIGFAVEHLHDYDAIALGLGAWVVPGAIVWLMWRPLVE